MRHVLRQMLSQQKVFSGFGANELMKKPVDVAFCYLNCKVEIGNFSLLVSGGNALHQQH